MNASQKQVVIACLKRLAKVNLHCEISMRTEPGFGVVLGRSCPGEQVLDANQKPDTIDYISYNPYQKHKL